MTSPVRVELTDAGSAPAVHVTEANELRAALDVLGLHPPRPTVVVVGGAAGLEEAHMNRLRAVFAVGIAPVMEKYRAVGVDGGTRFGVMRLFGEARAARQATFPLMGVVAAGMLKLPQEGASRYVETVLDPNHTHFVIVPGKKWGAESPWIARTATVLAGTARSITVLVNGGRSRTRTSSEVSKRAARSSSSPALGAPPMCSSARWPVLQLTSERRRWSTRG